MSERFVCERCGHAFESTEARCPKCLRKSGVRAEAATGAASEAARLASGDHAPARGARRATALGLAIAGSAGLGLGVLSTSDALARLGVLAPAIVAACVAAIAWLRVALGDAIDAPRPWLVIARRAGVGAGLGAWAFACGAVGLAATDGLSVLFAIALGAVLFLGGVIGALWWMQRSEQPTTPPAGKWR